MLRNRLTYHRRQEEIEIFHPHWVLATTLLDWEGWQKAYTDTETLQDRFEYFLQVVKAVVDLYAGGRPEDLRLIFWFQIEWGMIGMCNFWELPTIGIFPRSTPDQTRPNHLRISETTFFILREATLLLIYYQRGKLYSISETRPPTFWSSETGWHALDAPVLILLWFVTPTSTSRHTPRNFVKENL